jgi:putative hydrolase of the HAD superfamily
MSNRCKAVIFDLDDTLYPEKGYVLSGFRAVSIWAESRIGIPSSQGFAELCRLYEQGVRGDTFDQWLRSHDVHSAQLVSEFVIVYREHKPTLMPFPDVVPVLEMLGRQLRLGLVSDGYVTVQQRKWRSLGLSRYFEAVVFSDELGRENWKPSDKPFLVILERMQLKPSRVVYVGDNPQKDFLGARRVGMYTVRIRRPRGEYAHLIPPTQDHASHVTIETLSELQNLLSSHSATDS